MKVVKVSTSRTYIIRQENETASVEQLNEATRVAPQFNARVLKSSKLREGAYLLVIYFNDAT